MSKGAILPDHDGRLAENITHFARALRKAGVRVGPAQVAEAVRAVAAAGFSRKLDFYHVLRATLITRAEHLDLFHQVFAMFWRDPEYLERMIDMMSPTLRKDPETPPRKKAAERRAAEALTERGDAPVPQQERDEIEIETTLSWSATETLF